MRVSPSPKMMCRHLFSAYLLDTVIRKSGDGQSRVGDRKMGMRSGGLKTRGDLGRVASMAFLLWFLGSFLLSRTHAETDTETVLLLI